MHGRLKVKTTAEQEAEKQIERAKKLKVYNALMSKVFEKRKAKEFDSEALEATGQLLVGNPDIYTIWNVRKEILTDFRSQKENVELQEIMKNELAFTELCLRTNPKSYGSWEQRIWVLNAMSEPDWDTELKLCNNYLDLDERNFHCWDYRFYVVNRANVSPTKELELVDSKINLNFSNYSSWHYRSKLLPKIFPDLDGVRPINEQKLLEEFELVQNAAFTDPNDQSAWFYHRWLLGKGKQTFQLNCLYANRQNVILVLSKMVKKDALAKVKIMVNNSLQVLKWHSSSTFQSASPVWIAEFPDDYSGKNASSLEITASLESSKTEFALKCTLSENTEDSWTARPFEWNDFNTFLTAASSSVLEQQLTQCSQLQELEPDCKWPILTTILLRKSLDFDKHKHIIMNDFDSLMKADPMRTGYYMDLRSKFLLEHAIEKMGSGVRQIDLSGQILTSIYHPEYFAHLKTVDLSNNRLRSLRGLSLMLNVEILILNDNLVETCIGMDGLQSLKRLSLKNNNIESLEALQPLAACKALESLDLKGNLICKVDSDKLKGVLSLLKNLDL